MKDKIVTENMHNKWQTVLNMVDTNPALPVITLNVSGLYAPRQRLSECIKKQDPTICCVQETHFKYNNTYKLKTDGGKYTILTFQNFKRKAGVARLISEREDFKASKSPQIKKGIT